MRRFYEGAKEEMTRRGALVDKLVGDAANGFFLPGFTDRGYVDEAIESAEALLRRAREIESGGGPLEVGAGVHAGEAYMGSVGVAGDFADFTALGEEVNLAARLSGAAGGGELLVSDAALGKARRQPQVAERRAVELKGFAEPVEVNVVVPSRVAAR
jgi:adenylate cyclase